MKYLDNSNNDIRKEAIKSLYLYIALENVSAYEGLIDYYMELGSADNLEEVHVRMEIVEVLSRKISEQIEKILEVTGKEFTDIIETEIKKDVFVALKGEAKSDEEVKIFEGLIEMILCLDKHKNIRENNYGR